MHAVPTPKHIFDHTRTSIATRVHGVLHVRYLPHPRFLPSTSQEERKPGGIFVAVIAAPTFFLFFSLSFFLPLAFAPQKTPPPTTLGEAAVLLICCLADLRCRRRVGGRCGCCCCQTGHSASRLHRSRCPSVHQAAI
jgi:hypothetical protein